MTSHTADQLALLRAKATAGARTGRTREVVRGAPAAELPVARVAVDVSLPHLDRPFDYLVPAELDAQAAPGVRVRVRFAGQLVDGFLLERVASSEHPGTLARLDRVVSGEPVLTPECLALARAVAARYAGSLADVLRLAIPPRHAKVEAEPAGPRRPPPAYQAGWEDLWSSYETGPAFLRALASHGTPRAIWPALPGIDWAPALAAAVAAACAGGRGALIVLPDHRDVARLSGAIEACLGRGAHVALAADLGPAERYRRWLAVLRGTVNVVIGTRAAMFAPVRDLGLVACWDDGDDLHAEPRAPYPHVREVLCLRSHAGGTALLLGGFAVSAESAALLESGWAGPLPPAREALQRHAPKIRAGGDDFELARDGAAAAARLPSLAWRIARDALESGPVLVQVPRRGYLPALACVRCRGLAVCARCRGPLGLETADGTARCRLCAQPAVGWACPHCAATTFRAVRVGAERTAQELGRAFPGVVIRTAGAPGVAGGGGVDEGPALVVATPGAEPFPEAGYAGVLLLDGSLLLARPDLRAGEETLRRWMNAAALVRPGGVVFLGADPVAPPAAALIRWDPMGAARRELADRVAASFPPAVRLATLVGPLDAVAETLACAQLPPGTEVFGPAALSGEPGNFRAVLRGPRTDGSALPNALRAACGVRSARKSPGGVRVQIDPVEIG